MPRSLVPTSVLLVAADLDTTLALMSALAGARASDFRVQVADDLRRALDCLATGDTDVVLVDLRIAEPRPLDAIVLSRYLRPEVPVVAVVGPDDWQLGRQAVQAGAHDAVVRGRVAPELLERVLLYAIERAALAAEIRELATLLRDF